MDRATVAALIDHTLLAPEATPGQVIDLCADAVALGVGAVCVSPRWVVVAKNSLSGHNAPSGSDDPTRRSIEIASVAGFPSGAHITEIKAFEAQAAAYAGASEIDMVVSVGAIKAGTWAAVADDIRDVRAAVPPPLVLKVIVESAALTEAELRRVCGIAVDLGADYVKTSTGFHPSGGATTDAVRIMRDAVGPDVGVKASGGIRDTATALAMIDAGASRIGASASAAILSGLD